MKLLAHAHIDTHAYEVVKSGKMWEHMKEWAPKLAQAAKNAGHSAFCLGGHEDVNIPPEWMYHARDEIGIQPIRQKELTLKVHGGGFWKHEFNHVLILNCKAEPIPGFKPCESYLEDLLPYFKDTNCKVVLAHPKSGDDIINYAPHVDGIERENSLDAGAPAKFKCITESVLEELDKAEYNHIIKFRGSDIHISENRGDIRMSTELPDDYFGYINME